MEKKPVPKVVTVPSSQHSSQAGIDPEPRPLDVILHFDDDMDIPGEQLISSLKKSGIEITLTARELDKIRSRGPEFGKWLAADSSRRERFARDPNGTFARFSGTSVSKDPPKIKGLNVGWRGLGVQIDTTDAGAAVGEWALAEPGRLSRLQKNPLEAIKTALLGRSVKIIDAVLEKTTATKKMAEKKLSTTKRSRARISQ